MKSEIEEKLSDILKTIQGINNLMGKGNVPPEGKWYTLGFLFSTLTHEMEELEESLEVQE